MEILKKDNEKTEDVNDKKLCEIVKDLKVEWTAGQFQFDERNPPIPCFFADYKEKQIAIFKFPIQKGNRIIQVMPGGIPPKHQFEWVYKLKIDEITITDKWNLLKPFYDNLETNQIKLNTELAFNKVAELINLLSE